MKTAKTDWIPGNVRPLRPGVYERRYAPRAIWFCEWTGHQWILPSSSAYRAAKQRDASLEQGKPWRGLTYHEAKRAGTA